MFISNTLHFTGTNNFAVKPSKCNIGLSFNKTLHIDIKTESLSCLCVSE